jgi:hypothetical protein
MRFVASVQIATDVESLRISFLLKTYVAIGGNHPAELTRPDTGSSGPATTDSTGPDSRPASSARLIYKAEPLSIAPPVSTGGVAPKLIRHIAKQSLRNHQPPDPSQFASALQL